MTSMFTNLKDKKIIALLLCVLLLFTAVSCGKQEEQQGEVTNVDGGSIAYTKRVVYANWTEDSQIFTGALNAQAMAVSAVKHLPIYKFDSREELESFMELFKDSFNFDAKYDETESFQDVIKFYDESFFETNSVCLTYITASSGSYRFDINDIFCDGRSFCVYVKQVNDPEVGTCDMAGWFALAEVSKEDIKDCISFDALEN